MDNIREDREVVLLNFLGFLDRPTTARCLFQLDCADRRIDAVVNKSMSKYLRQLRDWSSDASCSSNAAAAGPVGTTCNRNFRLDAASPSLNLIVLGNGTLAADFTKRIRVGTRFRRRYCPRYCRRYCPRYCSRYCPCY